MKGLTTEVLSLSSCPDDVSLPCHSIRHIHGSVSRPARLLRGLVVHLDCWT